MDDASTAEPDSHAIASPVFGLLTPASRGAVGTVIVHAENLSQFLDRLFVPAAGRKFSTLSGRSVVYGNWINFDGSTGEDLIVCPIFHTTTKRDPDRNPVDGAAIQTAEIHCHGGVAAPAAIMESLVAHGFRAATADELDRLTGADVWTAGVDTALAAATTERTALLLLRQRTALAEAICRVREQIQSGDFDSASQRIRSMLAFADFGTHLSAPRSVVLCGSPNVGKSSLINAIVGFRRAIVHNTPGTTRDVVTQLTAVEGWPIDIKDTAGIRRTDEQIERSGIALASREISRADCVVAVLDAEAKAIGQPRSEDFEFVTATRPQIIVINKTDLVEDAAPVARAISQLLPDYQPQIIFTSATTGNGVPELIRVIASCLVPQLPAADSAFPVTASQIDRLSQSLDQLESGNGTAAIRLLR